MPNISKNSDLTSDRLLWSSMIAYIRLALWGCPSGCTATRHILEQDLPSSPSPHTSVHLDATDVGGGCVSHFFLPALLCRRVRGFACFGLHSFRV
ncbi:hypothetical protein FKM82_022608 [Ascaphus truei]